MPPAKRIVGSFAAAASSSSRTPRSVAPVKYEDKSSEPSSSASQGEQEQEVKPKVEKGKRKAAAAQGESKRAKVEEGSGEGVGGSGAASAASRGPLDRNVGKKFSPGQGQDDYVLSEYSARAREEARH